MADTITHLRVRVTDDLNSRDRRIEVLDPDGHVLGDLAASVCGITWKMGIRGLSVLVLEIASERAAIDSIEIEGLTVRRPD